MTNFVLNLAFVPGLVTRSDTSSLRSTFELYGCKNTFEIEAIICIFKNHILMIIKIYLFYNMGLATLKKLHSLLKYISF